MMWTSVKDSGKRQDFETGSVRDTREGKGRFDLLPARVLRELALHFEHGATKYGDRNWEKGQPMSRYIDSALRHLMGVLEGKTDENHLAAAAWNIMCCMDTRARIQARLLPESLNDLPTEPEPVEVDNPFRRSTITVGTGQQNSAPFVTGLSTTTIVPETTQPWWGNDWQAKTNSSGKPVPPPLRNLHEDGTVTNG